MSRRTIIVTGSNGFIGSLLVASLLKNKSFTVIGFSQGECRTPNHTFFNYLDINLADSEQVSNALKLFKPDVVIHCAGISQVDACENNPNLCTDANVNATQHLVNESSKINAHFVFLSSDFVFDGTNEWVVENTTPNPVSVYGKSKLSAEEVVKSSMLKWAIVRPVLVYGYSPSASRSNIFTWVLDSLKNGKHINVVEDQFRTPTFVMDVVNLIIGIIANSATGYFNIGGGEAISVLDFAKQIANIAGLAPVLIHPIKSADLKGASLRPKYSCFKPSKEIETLAVIPVGIQEGIKKSIQQFNLSSSLKS